MRAVKRRGGGLRPSCVACLTAAFWRRRKRFRFDTDRLPLGGCLPDFRIKSDTCRHGHPDFTGLPDINLGGVPVVESIFVIADGGRVIDAVVAKTSLRGTAV